jgi:hypothetical protein
MPTVRHLLAAPFPVRVFNRSRPAWYRMYGDYARGSSNNGTLEGQSVFLFQLR